MKLACDSLPLDERQNRVQLVLSPRTGMLAVDAQAGSLVKGSRLIPLLATALNWRIRFDASSPSRSRLAFLYRPALRWICLFHQVNTRSSSKGVLRSNLAELGILCG
ncbi:RHTO0S11e02278g1_1 [Rhodotorula toruloides]|uniref:RHTO0S11e02278g1_1 n=1 Tax=Rhodotorula toruloides TaxID=5286 RepID=A0A061BF49_RHOTO|nr:RHTO0S11e02278g1_1 [Rhodotorula toruloides]